MAERLAGGLVVAEVARQSVAITSTLRQHDVIVIFVAIAFRVAHDVKERRLRTESPRDRRPMEKPKALRFPGRLLRSRLFQIAGELGLLVNDRVTNLFGG